MKKNIYTKVKLVSCVVIGLLFIITTQNLIRGTTPTNIPKEGTVAPIVIGQRGDNVTYSIALQYGWNLISLPINQSIQKNNLTINYLGTNYTWIDAVNNNIVLGFIYRYNASTQTLSISDILVPGAGYWVFAYHPCILLAEGPSQGNGGCYWTKSGNDIYYTTGNVGIGTTTPTARLHIFNDLLTSSLFVENKVSKGVTYGLYSTVDSQYGRAIYGYATNNSGLSPTIGVYGVTNSSKTGSSGVCGVSWADDGYSYGVYGVSSARKGKGVIGIATSSAGSTENTVGVYGESRSHQGIGVQALESETYGNTYGVYAKAVSPNGTGVFGYANKSIGPNFGIVGKSESSKGVGIYGLANSLFGSPIAILGRANSPTGYAGFFDGRVNITKNVTVNGFIMPTNAQQDYVLTCNDTGVGTWQPPAGGSAAHTLDEAYDGGGIGAGRNITADAGPINISGPFGVLINGKVGIGVTNPTEKLDVNGFVKMTGFQMQTGAANNLVLTSDASGKGNWKPSQGNTLDQAYDQGGSGAGRNITADAGAVNISGPDGLIVEGSIQCGNTIINGYSEPTLKGSYGTNSASGVYVSGAYAYIAGTPLLQIIDVSNPSNPTLRGSYGAPGSSSSVYVSGNYAYVTCASGSPADLLIINVSNPSNPTLKGSYASTPIAREVYVSGSYAYIAGVSPLLQIIDVSNPSNPTLRGSYGAPGTGSGIYVSGTYAYVSCLYCTPADLVIINVSNPSNPTLKGSYSSTPVNVNDMYLSGTYAYLVKDGTPTLQIIDVSNPSNPTLEGSWGTQTASAVHVLGNYAYVTSGSASPETLLLIDISNPSQPTLHSSYGSSGGAKDVYISGLYVYIVKGGSPTLEIYTVSSDGIDTPIVLTGSVQAGDMIVTNTVDIGNDVYVHHGLIVGHDLFVLGSSSFSNSLFIQQILGNRVRVGINTTNPKTELQVNGTVTATAFVGDGSGLTNIKIGRPQIIYTENEFDSLATSGSTDESYSVIGTISSKNLTGSLYLKIEITGTSYARGAKDSQVGEVQIQIQTRPLNQSWSNSLDYTTIKKSSDTLSGSTGQLTTSQWSTFTFTYYHMLTPYEKINGVGVKIWSKSTAQSNCESGFTNLQTVVTPV
jgi:hypothetical protein